MTTSALAREVLTRDHPVTMPPPRNPFLVGPENPADVLKQTWAALAGLAGHMVNNPPANLTFDQASIAYGRMSRALRNLQPLLTAVGALPSLQPARGARTPSPQPVTSATSDTYVPRNRQIETMEEWNARHARIRKSGIDPNLPYLNQQNNKPPAT